MLLLSVYKLINIIFNYINDKFTVRMDCRRKLYMRDDTIVYKETIKGEISSLAGET